MEAMLLLLGAALLLAPFVGLILAITAHSRLAAVERRLAAVECGETARAAHAVAPSQPAMAPVATPPPRQVREQLVRIQAAQPPPPPPVVPPPPVAAPPPIAAPPSLPPQGGGSGRGPSPTSGGWEQWLGVRGAAALGAGVLVLAGLYFFKFSLEHGLIDETTRVVLGAIAGSACVGASEAWLRRRGHETLASWLTGAGIALFYLTFWAASARYHLIGTAVAGALMVLVTASCCALAIKRKAVPIALLGLLGGFATPILLSTGTDRPIALFSYLLVLDAALLFVAHRRRWPLLALASLVGTGLYQSLWIFDRMGPERIWLGMAITVVFAVLYALAPAPATEPEKTGTWRLLRAAALIAPFLFALYFGLEAPIDAPFWSTGLHLLVLLAGASFVAQRDRLPWLALAATGAALGAFAAWLWQHDLAANGWPVAAFGAAGAIVLAIAADRDERHEVGAPGPHANRESLAWAAGLWVAGGSLLVVTALRDERLIALAPWLLGWAVQALAAMRAAARPGREPLQLLLGGALGLTLLLFGTSQLRAAAPGAVEPLFLFAGTLLVLAAHALGALLLSYPAPRRAGAHGAALAALLVVPLAASTRVPALAAVAMVLVASALVAFAATRARAAAWTAVALALGAATLWAKTSAGAPRAELLLLYLGAGALALFGVGWALALGMLPREREQRWHWRVAALAGLFAFAPALAAHRALFGDEAVAAMPLALALLVLAALAALPRLGPRAADARTSAAAWLGGATLALVTVAAPLQLENEWITITWALEAAALLALWRRLDHVGLKYVAFALFAAVTVRLAANPWVLDYHPRGTLRIFNWLSYSYLVPAACLLLGWRLLLDREAARLRGWEKDLPALVGKLLAFFAVLVVFAWINLTIVDWFAVGRSLSLDLERLPARDLSLSLAWALYALVLLGVGIRAASGALRKVSLVLMLAACAKVFLYDLGHLHDLYRVLSLFGLALALIVVSLFYQRFVFRTEQGKAA